MGWFGGGRANSAAARKLSFSENMRFVLPILALPLVFYLPGFRTTPEQWTVQQWVEAFPFDSAPRYMLHAARSGCHLW